MALDEMVPELGPLEYVSGSHLWGDGRTGTAAHFFDPDQRALLESAGVELFERVLAEDGIAVDEDGLTPLASAAHNGSCYSLFLARASSSHATGVARRARGRREAAAETRREYRG